MATNKEGVTKRVTPKKDPREALASASKGASSGGTVVQTHDHLGTPAARRRLADLGSEDKAAAPKSDPKVTVTVPRPFRLHVLTDKGSEIVQYDSGIQEMPKSHAEHDYSIANGVEVVQDEK